MRARAFTGTLLLMVLALSATLAFSQTPHGFSYQAVIRNEDGTVLANQNILIRISLSDEAGTTTYYTEVHTTSTNALGIVNLVVGNGTTADNLSSVPWTIGNIWLKVEVDKTQTSGYTLLGSTRLYSVPYAFYSLNGTPGPQGPAGSKGDKGDTGLTGDAGNGIVSVLNNGDSTLTFYFTNGSNFQTPKLIGSQGLRGVQGEAGPQGLTGDKGEKGDTGNAGEQGLPGETGNGISSVVDNGNGTLTFRFTDGSTYLTPNLIGPQGEMGETGPEGPIGPVGQQGLQGEKGNPGTGLTSRGNWLTGTTYNQGDYVFAENSDQTGNSMWIVESSVSFISTVQPRLDSGKWIEFQAPAGPQGIQGPQGPVGPLVSGSSGQTLRHNGTTWEVSSLLFNDATNIGIGTTTPMAKLHVNGSILLPDDLTVGSLKIGNFGSYLGRQSSDGSTILNTGQGNIIFKNTGTESFRITSSGNVGIGTSNPISSLHIRSGGMLGNIRLETNSTGNNASGLSLFNAISGNEGASVVYGNSDISPWDLFQSRLVLTSFANGTIPTAGSKGVAISLQGNINGAQDFRIVNGNTLSGTLFTVNQSGNVGIGTASPTAKLHISTNGNPRAFRISGTASGDYTEAQFAGDGREYRFGVGGSTVPDGSANKFYLYDYNAGAFRLILDQTGNLGIGTTNPGTYKLNVNGGSVLISDGTGLSGTLKLTGHSYIGSADWGNLTLSTGSNSGNATMGFVTENVTRLTITGGGNVGIGMWPGVKLDVNGDIRSSSRIAAGGYGLNAGNLNGYNMEIGGPAPTGTNGQAAIFFHHHGVIAHQLRYNSGTLYLEAAGNGYGTSTTPSLSVGGSLYAGVNGGNIGIGTTSPNGRMVVQGSSTAAVTDPLFQVTDKNGNPVFTVYQDSVRIIVKDGTAKGSKGVFAVSGRNTSKALTNNFLKITPDLARIWTGDVTQGFAAENISPTAKEQYTKLTPNNSFVGHLAGRLTTGVNNAFYGTQSGYNNTSGYKNVFFGYQSGYSNTTAWGNIAAGDQALYSNQTGTYNVAIGLTALYANVSSGDNIAIGTSALRNTTGGYNVASGRQAMYSNTTGYGNVAHGWCALRANTTGYYNTGVGYGVDVNSGGWSNSTALGYAAYITASNQVRIGTGTVTSIGGYAGWSNLSDKRFKREVKSNVPGLEFILKLRPITYYLDMDKLASFLNTPDSLRLFEDERAKSKILQTGFAAQDVEEAASSLGYDFSGIDKPKNDKDYYSLRYSEFTVPLVKAVQELSAKLEAQQEKSSLLTNKLEKQKILNDELLKRIETLERLFNLNGAKNQKLESLIK